MSQKIKSGSHVCFIYKNKKEQMSVIIPFIKEGLERNEKCIYIADENSVQDIIDSFKKKGTNINSSIEKGQLIFYTKKETYLKDGFFDPEKIIPFLLESVKKASEENYSGLRIVVEMAWVLAELEDLEKIIEYESKLNFYFLQYPVSAICQYNESRFSPNILAKILYTHPLLILGENTYENFFYIPPEEFIRFESKISLETYQRMLNRIKEKDEIESHYYTLFQGIPDSIFIFDPETYRIIDVNDMALKKYGWEKEELLNRSVLDIIPPEDIKMVREIIQKIKTQEGFVSTFGIRHQKKDSSIMYRNVNVKNIKIKIKDRIYRLAIVSDIAEKIKSEREKEKSYENFQKLYSELLESQVLLNAFINSSVDGIVIVDENNIIKRWSKGAEKIFGWKEEEVKEKRLDLIVGGDRIEEAKKFSNEVLKHSKTIEVETLRYRKDGEPVFVHFTASPVLIENKFRGGIAIYRDITHRKKAEEEVKILQEDLFQARKMEALGTLAGGIAHDFNNILQVILGNLELAKMDVDKAHPVYSRLDRIEKTSERASELTQQILGFARKGKYEIKNINVNDIISDVTKILLRTFEKTIEIKTNLDKNLASIEGTSGQIQQSILNVCMNAREAMPEGGKLLIATENVYLDEAFTKTHVGSKHGNYVMISISDTGIGMDRDILSRIFEPFFTTKENGTGLGLSMVYGIVKNHDGYIDVASEEGKGTTVKIYFPALLNSPEKIKIFNEEKQETISSGSGRILVVDDEELIRDLASDILKVLGYDVILAKDGMEAINIYKNEKDKIDLVLLDIIMPKLSGKETYLELKKINPDVKVIISSGYSKDGYAQEILDEGAHGFIQKPYQINQLGELLREVLK
ncbi:MAG: MEDS domain-containing protein [Acidobacteriota bacterium]